MTEDDSSGAGLGRYDTRAEKQARDQVKEKEDTKLNKKHLNRPKDACRFGVITLSSKKGHLP